MLCIHKNKVEHSRFFLVLSELRIIQYFKFRLVYLFLINSNKKVDFVFILKN